MFNLLVFREMKKLWPNTAAGAESSCRAKSYGMRQSIEIQVFGVFYASALITR